MTSTCEQPEWLLPKPERGECQLKVFNSMTRSLVPFVPAEGKLVQGYSCGPTVYDAAHIGRPQLHDFRHYPPRFEGLFHHDITYVMNITDIDDKIILRARQGHLLKEFADSFW